VLLADLDQVDGPRESRLVGVRRVTRGDEYAPRGIQPALDVIVHMLTAHASSPVAIGIEEAERTYSAPLTASGDIREHSPRQVICHLIASHSSGEVPERPAPQHRRQ
jgi:hypothetical protein